MLNTRPLLLKSDFPPLARDRLGTLQVNLGYRCNQSCSHCHVNAGPTRTEQMGRETVDLVLAFASHQRVEALDLTGGAPELNPHFRYLVERGTRQGLGLIDRCNLSILSEPGQEDLADFLAAHGVTVVASLPCYEEANVDGQRGRGVFESSLRGLRRLNSLGYGREPDKILNLVYNPTGPYLPPPQAALEEDYRRELQRRHGIVFNSLLSLANMPIARFGSVLLAKGQYHAYMRLLKENFAAGNLRGLMCRTLLSVDYGGYLYDCDFNQMLDLPLRDGGQRRPHLRDLLDAAFEGRPIAVGEHCYGCAAGQGSSCGGALT